MDSSSSVLSINDELLSDRQVEIFFALCFSSAKASHQVYEIRFFMNFNERHVFFSSGQFIWTKISTGKSQIKLMTFVLRPLVIIDVFTVCRCYFSQILGHFFSELHWDLIARVDCFLIETIKDQSRLNVLFMKIAKIRSKCSFVRSLNEKKVIRNFGKRQFSPRVTFSFLNKFHRNFFTDRQIEILINSTVVLFETRRADWRFDFALFIR